MASGNPGQPPASQPHTNPDYYAETASLGPAPPAYHSVAPPPPAPQPHAQHPYYSPQPQHPYTSQQPQHPYTSPQPQQPQYSPPPGPPPSGYYQPGQPSQQGHYEAPPPPQPPRPSSGISGQYAPPPASPGSGKPPASADGQQRKKPTFGERFHQWSVKAGVPINKLTNKLGSEAFWPTTLDEECAKAARILNSFCKDGFYAPGGADSAAQAGEKRASTPTTGPKNKPKVLVKIPSKVIQSAAGLAIFTTFRTGLHLSGAGGSGIVIARRPDGSWSPPSGFLVHTLGAGFMIGLDIYDCVCVLRTPAAVKAFTHPRVSIGGEISVVAGPIGSGANVEAALSSSNTKPVWSYMKSRGLYAGVQADGTIIIGRPDANAAFYGKKGITVDQILSGDVPVEGPPKMWPVGAQPLYEVLKISEGRSDYNAGVVRDLSGAPTPGDLAVSDHGSDHEEGVYGGHDAHDEKRDYYYGDEKH